VITAMIALYLNFFVLIVQSFRKVPALTALAPTQSKPPFVIAQGVTLVLFVAFTIIAAKKFRAA
jgi:purine-cytosine permease-like protein